MAAVAAVVGAAGGLGDDVLAWISVAVLMLAGLITAVWGRQWPALSSRFSADPSSRSLDPGSLWRDLDRGTDPTDDGQHPDPPRV
jgi:hypothetical protein